MAKFNWYVQLYLLDRAFGGHEEGGWWFDTGEPVDCPENRGFPTREAARSYLAYLYESGDADFLADWNAGRAPVSSVSCEGIFDFKIVQTPEAFPAERPRYE